jgi:hypothetical protein
LEKPAVGLRQVIAKKKTPPHRIPYRFSGEASWPFKYFYFKQGIVARWLEFVKRQIVAETAVSRLCKLSNSAYKKSGGVVHAHRRFA